MAELIWRLRAAARPGPGARHGDLLWVLLVGGAAALLLAWTLTLSIQAACGVVLVVVVIALYQHDRRLGIVAMFAVWFLAPGLRRLLGLVTGYVENDPLSLAPYLATAAIAALELLRIHVPTPVRRVFLVAAAGFALGLPLGLVAGPRSAVYAFTAYLAGLSGAVLGMREGTSTRGSALRQALLFGLPPIALYAVLQRLLPLPGWDQLWIDATEFSSIGVAEGSKVRVFGTLNSPGTLAAMLGLALLATLTVHRARALAIAGAAVMAVALALTFGRAAWVALIAGALAHVIASNGRSARVVLGSAAIVVAATLALAPVSATAGEVLERFTSMADFSGDTSSNERRAIFRNTFPTTLDEPAGHGLGTAGEATKLTGQSSLRAPDNGYLSLIYQTGPIGFLLVLAAVAVVVRAAWRGARARGPGQDLRLMLFAMLVFLLTQLVFGDAFYGVTGVVLWFIAGQVLAYDFRAAAARAPAGQVPATGSRGLL